MRYLVGLLCLTGFAGLFLYWFNKPVYVMENPTRVEDLVDDLKAVEKAILRIGPLYQYRIEPDGTLEIKLNNQWLRLRY